MTNLLPLYWNGESNRVQKIWVQRLQVNYLSLINEQHCLKKKLCIYGTDSLKADVNKTVVNIITRVKAFKNVALSFLIFLILIIMCYLMVQQKINFYELLKPEGQLKKELRNKRIGQ